MGQGASAFASPWKDEATREAERGEKREAVLRVAAQSFCEKGVRATSLDDIAAQLNVTKPTLYHYFRSKDDILVECVRTGLALIDEAIAASAAAQGTALDRLRAALHRYAELMTEDFGMCVTRIAETELSPEGRAAFRAHKRQIDQRLRGLIRAGMDEGSLRRGDATLTAFTVAGALNWIARWYDPAGALAPEAVAEQVVSTLLDGLVAPRKAGG